jgi:tRNA (mo5U34)-methyltransferase
MSTPAIPSARLEHEELQRAFRGRCGELGLSPDPRLFWYHTVELGRGLVTPGSFDYRSHLAAYGFPEDLRGHRALDVGSATGFFAFELERRGAEVTSVEIPALEAWDRFPGEPEDEIVRKIGRLLPHHAVGGPEALADFVSPRDGGPWHHLLDGPFRLCHAALGSRVARRYSTVYDLARSPVAAEGPFRVVFAGDMILHLIDPLRALAALAPLCADLLVLAQEVPAVLDPQPAVLWTGAERAEADVAEWWRPNLSWFRAVLHRLGFPHVEAHARFTGTVRPEGHTFEKTVIHARR